MDVPIDASVELVPDQTSNPMDVPNAATVELKPDKTSNVPEGESDDLTLLSSSLSVSISVDSTFGKATEAELCMNLVTGGLGTGILCIPWLIAGASIVPAMLLMAFVLITNVWTISILIDLAEETQEFCLGALIMTIGGNTGKVLNIIIDVFVFVSLFCLLVGYIMVKAENMSSITPIPYWAMCLISSALALPLCYLSQSKLVFSSSVCVAAFAYMLVLMFVNLGKDGVGDEVCRFGYSRGLMSFFGAIANCICVQMCVLPMYSDLKNRTPRKMKRVVIISFGALFLLFAGFGLAGYLLYGKTVDDNISTTMTTNHPGVANTISLITISLAMLGVYPIMCMGMMSPVYNLPRGVNKYANYVIAAAVVCSGALAIPLKGQLGKLNIIIGSLSATLISFGIPSLLGYILLGKSSIIMGFLMLLGVIFGVFGCAFMDNYADELICKW